MAPADIILNSDLKKMIKDLRLRNSVLLTQTGQVRKQVPDLPRG